MIHLNKVLILDKKCISTGESYIGIDTGEGTSVILTSSDNDVYQVIHPKEILLSHIFS